MWNVQHKVKKRRGGGEGVYQTKAIYLTGRRLDYLLYSILPKRSVTVTYLLSFPLRQLLRESEANSMRLTEQAKVLKDEIRR